MALSQAMIYLAEELQVPSSDYADLDDHGLAQLIVRGVRRQAQRVQGKKEEQAVWNAITAALRGVGKVSLQDRKVFLIGVINAYKLVERGAGSISPTDFDEMLAKVRRIESATEATPQGQLGQDLVETLRELNRKKDDENAELLRQLALAKAATSPVQAAPTMPNATLVSMLGPIEEAYNKRVAELEGQVAALRSGANHQQDDSQVSRAVIELAIAGYISIPFKDVNGQLHRELTVTPEDLRQRETYLDLEAGDGILHIRERFHQDSWENTNE